MSRYRALRREMLAQGGDCAWAGTGRGTCSPGELTLDFIVPWREWLKRGGAWDDRRNLQLLCSYHNSRKG